MVKLGTMTEPLEVISVTLRSLDQEAPGLLVQLSWYLKRNATADLTGFVVVFRDFVNQEVRTIALNIHTCALNIHILALNIHTIALNIHTVAGTSSAAPPPTSPASSTKSLCT